MSSGLDIWAQAYPLIALSESFQNSISIEMEGFFCKEKTITGGLLQCQKFS